MIDPSELLAKLEQQIKEAEGDKETRAPVMAQVEKFLHAVDQERWLDEYNKVTSCFITYSVVPFQFESNQSSQYGNRRLCLDGSLSRNLSRRMVLCPHLTRRVFKTGVFELWSFRV